MTERKDAVMTDETMTTPAAETNGNVKTWKRRGLLVAAVALGAGLVAKLSEQPVEAATANVMYNTVGPGSFPNDVGSTVLVEPGTGLSCRPRIPASPLCLAAWRRPPSSAVSNTS